MGVSKGMKEGTAVINQKAELIQLMAQEKKYLQTMITSLKNKLIKA